MKEGDKVRVISTVYNNPNLAVGQTGKIVVGFNTGGLIWGVLMDNGHIPCDPMFYLEDTPSWSFYPDELEVIE